MAARSESSQIHGYGCVHCVRVNKGCVRTVNDLAMGSTVDASPVAALSHVALGGNENRLKLLLERLRGGTETSMLNFCS